MQTKPPAYTLHRKSGLARTRLKGRDFYLGKHGSPESWEKYAKLLREHSAPSVEPVETEPQQRRTTMGNVHTLAECMLRFTQHAKATFRDWENVKNPQFANYRLIFRIMNDKFGALDIESFRGPQTKQLLAAFVEAGWSRNYCNDQLQRTKRFLKWCVSEDLCSSEVFARVSTVEGLRVGQARETERVKPVPDNVFAAVLPHLPAVVADLLRVQALTGARPGELRRLKIGEVARGDVAVIKTAAGDITVIATTLAHHKNSHRGQSRTLFFGPRAQSILAPYLSRDANEAVFSPQLSEQLRHAEMRARRKSPVQPSQVNRRSKNPKRPPSRHYTKDGLNKCIVRACEVAFAMPLELRNISKTIRSMLQNGEITEQDTAGKRAELRKAASEWRAKHTFSANMIRHKRGTEIRRDYGIEHAQALLGHANLSTSQIYAEVDFDRAIQIAAEIG